MRMQRGIRRAAILFTLCATAACRSVNAQGRGYPYPNYPNQRSGVFRGYQGPAYNRGFDDGYRQGLDAARDGDRYDVRREGQYRSADRGYDRRYGSRSDWQRVYRNGFTQGYDRGYRDGRYQTNGRYRR